MKNSSASGRCGVQVAQGVDRVGGARPVDVDPADREPRVGRRRDDRHQVAVLGRADLALVLLPGLTGGHEDDLVEPEPGLHLGGGHQVAVVDRVERPPITPRRMLSGRACGGSIASWWTSGSGTTGRLQLVGRVAEAPRSGWSAARNRPERDEEERDVGASAVRGLPPRRYERRAGHYQACAQPSARRAGIGDRTRHSSRPRARRMRRMPRGQRCERQRGERERGGSGIPSIGWARRRRRPRPTWRRGRSSAAAATTATPDRVDRDLRISRRTCAGSEASRTTSGDGTGRGDNSGSHQDLRGEQGTGDGAAQAAVSEKKTSSRPRCSGRRSVST